MSYPKVQKIQAKYNNKLWLSNSPLAAVQEIKTLKLKTIAKQSWGKYVNLFINGYSKINGKAIKPSKIHVEFKLNNIDSPIDRKICK